jgi:hypothetical protein
VPKSRPKPKSKPSKPARRPKTPSRAVSVARRGSTAIVVRAPGRHPWNLTADEVIVLKNAVCKNATDEELKFCLAVARRYELDPFQQQIWFVPRYDKDADAGNGRKGRNVYVPQVAMNGLLHVAARDHKDFGSYGEPEYGPMIEVTFKKNGEGSIQKLMVPEWCRIEAWKKGATQPTVAKIWWAEIYPNVDYAPLVRRMPRLMLAKCTRAQATRTAYPKTGGLEIPEENQPAGPPQETPGGRQIIQGAASPMDAYKAREAEQIAQMPAEAQERIKGRMAQADQAGEIQQPRKPAFSNGKNRMVTPEYVGGVGGVVGANVENCVIYRHYPDSNTWQLFGSDPVLHANRELFMPFWDEKEGALIARDPAQLGRLFAELERRKVPFRAYNEGRQPGDEA